jgi:glycosyltransferase involved in cell wall biosynthesis
VKRHVVLLLGPSREAISGVTTHLNALFGSRLAAHFDLAHFQVGSEGRKEGALGKLVRLLTSPFALAAAILRHDAELVHINTSLNAKSYWRDLAYLVVGKLCGARVVYQVHGGSLATFHPPTVRWAARLPDVVVVLSQAERDRWRALAPTQLVEALPNGIDCQPYQRYNRELADRDTPLRLIYIGRLAPGKGLLESLEALRIARSRGVAARLVLVGGGAEEPRLRQYVREAGLTRDVTFVGPAYGDAKARLLSQADALLLPSYSEGLPYSLLEAMAAGVVPVVTPVGAIPDVVTDGEHGLIVPPRDAEAIARAIEQLSKDRAAVARMSATCRKHVASAYSIERVAKDFSELYWGLCARPAPTPAR